MLRRIRGLAISLLLLMCCVARAQSRSAADLYRSAARQVPATTNPDEEFVLKNVFDAPLDATAIAIVARGGTALELFDVASNMSFGEWGFDPTDPGSGARIIAGGNELADLVILRARLSAAEGRIESALDDCHNLAVFSRRLSVEPSLTRLNQQTKLFAKSVAAIAMLAPAAELERAALRLDNLRAAADPVEVAKLHKIAFLSYYRRLVGNSELRYLASRPDMPFNELLGISGTPVDVEDLSASSPQAAPVFAEVEKTFDDMTIALAETPADRDKSLREIRDRIRGSHALVKEVDKAITQILDTSASQKNLLAMLHVAVRIRTLDPESAVKQVLPYLYTPAGDGFDLETPATMFPASKLQIGRLPTRSRPATAPAGG